MRKVYDDWERLVGATLRKQELWELFHDHSRTPSGGSTASASSTTTTPISPSASASSLNRIVAPTAGVLPLTNSTTRFKSSGAINEEEDANNGFLEEEEKKMMRRSKPRMRLDRWILTRWLSKTFHSTSP